MKANEAPEKIILSADRETGILYNEWVVKDLTDNIKIEYIRKDAFIKKACDWIDDMIWDYLELKHPNADTYFGVDMERFKEDFKNYMKGE